MSTKVRSTPNRFISVLSRRPVIISLVCVITVLCIAASLSSMNTYIVYDGDDVSVLNSAVANCSDALVEMGISFDANDYVEMPDKPVGGIAKIHIHRKNEVTVNDGTSSQVLFADEEDNISSLLSKNGITLSEHDVLSLPADSLTTEGMSVSITRVSYSTEEEYKDIAFKKTRRASASLAAGNEKVVQKGVLGQSKLVYKIKTENGNVTGKELVSETVVKEPVNQIVEYGTKAVSNPGTVTTFSGEKLKYKKVLNVTATAYTTERTSDKITATGKVARVGLVAVDPKVIPLGSKLYIVAADGKSWSYGTAVAADTGVKGNKIDLFYNTYNECISFGRRKAKVYVLE